MSDRQGERNTSDDISEDALTQAGPVDVTLHTGPPRLDSQSIQEQPQQHEAGHDQDGAHDGAH